LNVLITGISGLIGKHLAFKLLEDKNYQIFGQYYSTKDLDFFIQHNIQLTKADINNPNELVGITKNIDILVHTAARVIDFGSKKDFYDAHYFATKYLLEDGIKNKLQHFIYISSVGVASGIDRNKIIPNEETPTPKTGILYDDVKIDTERLVIDFCVENKIKYTIIRPSAVVGPASVWVKEPIERKLKKGFFPLIDDGKNSACLVDVRNLANGIYKTITLPIAYNNIYFFIDDFTNITWKQYFTDLLNMVGTQPSLAIPYKFIYPIASIMEWLANITNKKPLIAKKSLKAIGTKNRICRKSKKELQWKSEFQYKATLEYIREWVNMNYPNHK
jgi:nucleoside-diphosphate-sugar epimerase